MQQSSKTGVCIDNRPQDEKAKDYKHEEIAMGFKPYVWEERPAKLKYYFPYNQVDNLSCMATWAAIVIEHFDGGISSTKDPYQRRVNYPSGGMIQYDLFNIARGGVATQELVPSQSLSENKMNERYTVTDEIVKSRAKRKVLLTFTINNITIDAIANAVTSSPVCAMWYFDENGIEWKKNTPEIQYNFSSFVGNGVTRHQVTIVDAILINGKKFLVGQDSWGIGTGFGANSNLRYISEEMVNKRLYSAGYAIDDEDEILKPEPITKPKYSSNKALQVGSVGVEVKALQSILIYEGVLNIKAPTGYFGGLTRTAVVKLQEKYKDEILKPANLKSGTGYVGTLTNKFLNAKYS